MANFFKSLLGDNQNALMRRLKRRVNDINALEEKYKKMKDPVLRKQTDILKKRLEKESLDKILPDAFAVVREAARRKLGQRHFDVQLIGGMALHEGNVAEMKTGEGKTLVATAPVYLNALTEKGVHVVTVNEYLVQRDAGWMGQVYEALGLTTGVIIPDASYIYDATYTNKDHADERFRHLRPCSRQEAYNADITYGTNNEFGFDYLRDNMVREVDQLRQRKLHFAIVDEVDSILIDEARTPLIISAPSTSSGQAYTQFARVVSQLKPEHYTVDEKEKRVSLNDDGVEKVEKLMGVKNLYEEGNVRTIYHLEQALRAQTLFVRDKDYVVTSDGEVVIVDEFTGRLLKGRRYNEGLHQAIEAKESVTVQQESMTLATISFQNYFRLYEKLSGMTGTAMTESEEFHQIYKLSVIDIPTNQAQRRKDLPDRIKQFIKEESSSLGVLLGNDKGFEKTVTEIFPFDEETLNRLFDAEADKFATVLEQEAIELYEAKELTFSSDLMREIERDIYFQILDNLWMQHLEDMEHLREGIHWASVGQRDPLVEYRSRGQAMFEAMQHVLRREVLRNIMHAVPMSEHLDHMHDTELTRAAKNSVDNAANITEAEVITEDSFKVKKTSPKGSSSKKKKDARKAQRQNRKKNRR